MLFFFLNNFFR